jgi:integrase/recombinase XerD
VTESNSKTHKKNINAGSERSITVKNNAVIALKAKRTGDGFKYFNELQIKLIRRKSRNSAQLAKEKGNVTAVRDWMLIDLLTSTGMREAEAADMRCGDILAGYGQSACYVRNGKDDKSRTIQIPDSLRIHLKSFLVWKQEYGEPVGTDDYLFIGQRGPWTPWAVGEIVKKYLRQLGLYQNGKSAHSLRHSYAVQLYCQKRDLRAVQKQLGHSSIQTTQKYADVLTEDIQEQIKGLWN